MHPLQHGQRQRVGPYVIGPILNPQESKSMANNSLGEHSVMYSAIEPRLKKNLVVKVVHPYSNPSHRAPLSPNGADQLKRTASIMHPSPSLPQKSYCKALTMLEQIELLRKMKATGDEAIMRHVCFPIDILRNGDDIFVFYERAAHGDLRALLAREGKKGLRAATCRRHIRQLAEVLQSMHARGFLHGSLRLENILINDDNTLQLTGFSRARYVPPPERDAIRIASVPEISPGVETNPTNLTVTALPRSMANPRNSIAGYISPEEVHQPMNQEISGGTSPLSGTEESVSKTGAAGCMHSYDPFKAEVWALGVCTYKLLTGMYPFQPIDTNRLNSSSRPRASMSPMRNSEAFQLNDDKLHVPVPESVESTPASISDGLSCWDTLTFPSHVSPLAVNFVRQLLHPIPNQRISLVDALRHPWFMEGKSLTYQDAIHELQYLRNRTEVAVADMKRHSSNSSLRRRGSAHTALRSRSGRVSPHVPSTKNTSPFQTMNMVPPPREHQSSNTCTEPTSDVLQGVVLDTEERGTHVQQHELDGSDSGDTKQTVKSLLRFESGGSLKEAKVVSWRGEESNDLSEVEKTQVSFRNRQEQANHTTASTHPMQGDRPNDLEQVSTNETAKAMMNRALSHRNVSLLPQKRPITPTNASVLRKQLMPQAGAHTPKTSTQIPRTNSFSAPAVSSEVRRTPYPRVAPPQGQGAIQCRQSHSANRFQRSASDHGSIGTVSSSAKKTSPTQASVNRVQPTPVTSQKHRRILQRTATSRFARASSCPSVQMSVAHPSSQADNGINNNKAVHGSPAQEDRVVAPGPSNNISPLRGKVLTSPITTHLKPIRAEHVSPFHSKPLQSRNGRAQKTSIGVRSKSDTKFPAACYAEMKAMQQPHESPLATNLKVFRHPAPAPRLFISVRT